MYIYSEIFAGVLKAVEIAHGCFNPKYSPTKMLYSITRSEVTCGIGIFGFHGFYQRFHHRGEIGFKVA